MTTAHPWISSVSGASHEGSGIPRQSLSSADELEVLRDRCDQLARYLVEAQRNSLLGELALVIAHEFNNLLTPVVMRADVALLDQQPEEMREALEQVIDSIQRAINFSTRVLALGKSAPTTGRSEPINGPGSESSATPQSLMNLQDGSLRTNRGQPSADRSAGRQAPTIDECDVGATVESAVSVLARFFEKAGIELACDAPAGLRAKLPHELLAQVCINLLMLSRDRLHGQRGRIRLTVEPAGAWIALSVHDSSAAKATPAEREALATSLASAVASQAEADPCGLGLRVSRLIADLCGGRIELVPHPSDAGAYSLRALFPAAV